MTSSDLHGRYHGTSGALFGLYIKTALLTLLTLGIYRFWAKTRIRKYIWSATDAGGDTFEYTGTGLEKLLGFLVAVVILAIYLGVVQMALFYFGIFLFAEPQNDFEVLMQLAGIYITFFAVLPLIFFAQYRARRYKMARTRWRGLRFGMENGALGYMLRACGHTFLSVITLGLLIPRQTFKLEKYMSDRTWYGNGKFEQGGRWTGLLPGMKHAIFAVVFLIAVGVISAMGNLQTFAFLGMIAGYFWLMFGTLQYQVYAFNYLTSYKVLDGVVEFVAEARTSRVVTIYFVGVLVTLMVLAVFGLAGFAVIWGMIQSAAIGGNIGAGSSVLVVLLYVGAMLVAGGVSLVMITQKMIAHFVGSITMEGAEHLDYLRQRSADEGADAEGFADALDVGAAV